VREDVFVRDLLLGVKDLFMHKKHSLHALNIKITIYFLFVGQHLLWHLEYVLLASQVHSYVLHFEFHETLTVFLRTFKQSASKNAKFGNPTETRLSVIIMIVLKVQNRNRYFCIKGVKEAILARGGIISTRPEGPMDYKTPNGQNRLLFQNTQVHT
jgi:hypothetical protein